MGTLLLQGGGEFGGQMKTSDMRGIELAGGLQTPVCIIPTAAVPDNNHEHAGSRGRNWFHGLGAQNVSIVRVVDTLSANDPAIAAQLRQSGFIYMIGGFPIFLAKTLKDTRCWNAMIKAYDDGAIVAGTSAGAMVLCEYLFDPDKKTIQQGLGLISGCCILPHHNTFGRLWAPRIQKHLPKAVLIGIDEQTGIINDGLEGTWNVYGAGGVTIYRNNQSVHHNTESSFSISHGFKKDR